MEDAMPQALSDAFVRILRDSMSPEEWMCMRYENRQYDLEGSPCCASHNYLDSNMAMWPAFVEVVGREPDFDDLQDRDVSLINAAWAIAQRDHLTERW